MSLLTQATPQAPAAGGPDAPVVVFKNVQLAFDDKVILKDVSFELLAGHTKIFLGASGSGKSTILKLIVGLLRPDAGEIYVNGHRTDQMNELELMTIRHDLGMVFQEGALFDSLTVAENVGYKLYEETDMPLAQVRSRVQEVLGFVGLDEFIDRMPSELSGGQRRRVAIANASNYGLSGAIWTQNLSKAHTLARALRCGSVAVNAYSDDAHDMTVPFGGYKQSGFGRDKSLHALDKYTQLKTTWVNLK